MSEHTAENDAQVDYEVWRSQPNGRDVRLYFGLTEKSGRQALSVCLRDKAEAYPDSPIDFYLARVSRTRLIPPGSTDPSPAQGAGAEEADR